MFHRFCEHCDEYFHSMSKLKEIVDYAYEAGIRYDGKKYDFCPFCGEYLETQERIKWRRENKPKDRTQNISIDPK